MENLSQKNPSIPEINNPITPTKKNSTITHKIIKVEKVEGKTLETYWDAPMWRIETDKGHYIQAVSNVSEEKLKGLSFQNFQKIRHSTLLENSFSNTPHY